MTELVAVAFAHNEPEADMICARLADAGIQAVSKRSVDIPQFGSGGAREIYVEDHLATAAREALATPEFTDEELAELSDQAGRQREDPA